MKRIPGKIAVESVLYVVGGLEQIKVVDKESVWTDDEKVIFEGKVRDFGFEYWKARKSEVHHIMVEGNTLIMVICTRSDTY